MKKTTHTEATLQARLYGKYFPQRPLCIPNFTYYQNESDFLTVTKAGYVDEYEIKISRSDYKAEQKKPRWRGYEGACYWDGYPARILNGQGKEIVEYTRIYKGRGRPNRFWYVTPVALIEPEELPPYAGLIVCPDKSGMRTVVKAPQLHKEKAPERLHDAIFRAAYYRFTNRESRRLWEIDERLNRPAKRVAV